MSKATIEVGSKREAQLVQQAMQDPETRCFVHVMGAMQALPNEGARRRVLNWIIDKLEEEKAAAAKASGIGQN